MVHCIHSKILCLKLSAFTLFLLGQGGSAFSTNQRSTPLELRSSRLSTTLRQNWLGDLSEEVIEFSTYGPSERKLLKERREKAAVEEARKNGGDVSMDSFQKAQQKHQISHPEKTQRKNERQQPSSDTYGRYHVTTIYSGFNIAGRIISNIFFMIRANENPI